MNNERLNQLYGEIAQIVAETIPEKWEKFYLYGEVLEAKHA
ncbi:immunity protein YezG family protein [Shouchella miscanthi]|nr:immunity protein YezG family protein [Shouchella miscanthi]